MVSEDMLDHLRLILTLKNRDFSISCTIQIELIGVHAWKLGSLGWKAPGPLPSPLDRTLHANTMHAYYNIAHKFTTQSSMYIDSSIYIVV